MSGASRGGEESRSREDGANDPAEQRAERRRRVAAYGPADDAIDFRAEPHRYRIARGEQGVFHVRPYNDELLPLWRFRTPEIARESALALWDRFATYRDAGDFVGMDMARKTIQMGVTRSRRYANHRSGRKYAPDGSVLPPDPDPVKAASAREFMTVLERVNADPAYLVAKADHLARFEAAARALAAGRRAGASGTSAHHRAGQPAEAE